MKGKSLVAPFFRQLDWRRMPQDYIPGFLTPFIKGMEELWVNAFEGFVIGMAYRGPEEDPGGGISRSVNNTL
jgi:hypothetical protein